MNSVERNVEKNDQQSLGKLRKNHADKTPQFECSNCKCKRYSPCGCVKRRG